MHSLQTSSMFISCQFQVRLLNSHKLLYNLSCWTGILNVTLRGHGIQSQNLRRQHVVGTLTTAHKVVAPTMSDSVLARGSTTICKCDFHRHQSVANNRRYCFSLDKFWASSNCQNSERAWYIEIYCSLGLMPILSCICTRSRPCLWPGHCDSG